jgi:hypothetical protein
MSGIRIAVLLAMAALLAGTVGCGSTRPASFYVLSAVERDTAAPAGGEGPALGIGPVTLPGYLDRPQIVSRSGRNELRIDEYRRWGEPLAESITRALGENLSRLLGSEKIASFPWKGTVSPDYRVLVEVIRMDRDAGGDFVFVARWTILEGESNRVAEMRRFEWNRPIADSDDAESIVAGASDALAEMSREIAEAIPSTGSP